MIVAIWGLNKTGKTTVSLTFPQPLYHCDFDLGYDRAAHRFQGQEMTSKAYPLPIQDTMPSAKAQPIMGVKELYYKFLKDYNEHLKDKVTQTIVIDTASQLWEVIRLAFLQEKQEGQLPLGPGEKLRERLLPIEYTEPNARMRSIIYAAKTHKKHLVLTHYARDEYITKLSAATGRLEDVRSGKLELDGFKSTGGLVDLVTSTYLDDSNQPCMIVTLCGLDLKLAGMSFASPTYDMIVGALETLRTNHKDSPPDG